MSYDVKVLKLVTGEEVLAKVEAINDDTKLSLKDARTLAYGQDGRPGMIPFMQLAPDRAVIISASSVIGEVFPVDPEMERKYLSDTSGIALP